MSNIGTFIEENENVLNKDKNSCGIIRMINQARRFLYPLGEWVGTMTYATINIKCDPCVYLPYEMETAKSASSGCSHINVESNTFCFISEDEYCQCGCNRESMTLVNTDRRSPIPYTINSTIAFMPRSKLDAGKKLKIGYNNDAGTERIDEVILKQRDLVYTSSVASGIRYIKKDKTLGMVDVFELMKGGKESKRIHSFYPQETNPTYSLYSFKGCVCECIVIYGKKRFIPYAEPEGDSEDYLDIELDISDHALALAIKALEFFASGSKEDIALYKEYTKLSLEYLRQERKDKKSATFAARPVNFNPDINLGVNDEYNTGSNRW